MNSQYSIIYSEEALKDINNIYIYICYFLSMPEVARNQIVRIKEKISSLQSMPFRYQLIDFEHRNNIFIHKMPADRFVVFFTIDESDHTVNIIRICYGSQEIQKQIKMDESKN